MFVAGASGEDSEFPDSGGGCTTVDLDLVIAQINVGIWESVSSSIVEVMVPKNLYRTIKKL